MEPRRIYDHRSTHYQPHRTAASDPGYRSLRAFLLVKRQGAMDHLRKSRPHETHARERSRDRRERSHVPHSARPISLFRIGQSQAEQVAQIGSKSMTDEIMLKLARRVNELLHQPDVDGVVVTHGTDTLEETSYLLNLTIKSDKPVVFAAAMRPSTALSADGPLNLFNAVILAGSKQAIGKGVLVSMDDNIFTARDIAKTNTFKTDTFRSPYGPLGYIAEGRPYFYRLPARPHTTQTEFDIAQIEALPKVDIVYGYANIDRTAYDAFVNAG